MCLKKLTVSLFLLVIPLCSHAGNSLPAICSGDDSTMISNVVVQKLNISTVWPEGVTTGPALNVELNGVWYGISMQDVGSGGGGYGISQYVQTMALLQQHVDACVKGSILRGIVNTTTWPVE
ncbi:hypothetical protein ELZ88_24485 (plasmid) [Salmonella enterica subsp. enterica serovar Karamoja]|uniref:Fimbrial protein n=1 Tax=Salmonella enterica subsp. enterica serovar Karamoja TaxID=2500153 RepID=A0A3Q9MM54_SALET|nr:hypothetical protein [Salmonella enterica]AZT39688.1 hypothetical protein ELZ88_24485 [Salmonella enterica subsp. enterica serovar Karamoja]AZT44412.1 hypothetical protein EL007_24460 [Salmonella enterica subsp. enterica serovar Karamoja]